MTMVVEQMHSFHIHGIITTRGTTTTIIKYCAAVAGDHYFNVMMGWKTISQSFALWNVS